MSPTGSLSIPAGLVIRSLPVSAPAAETDAIITFDVLNTVALLLNAGVLLPALLSPSVSRTSTWMAMITSMIFYTSSYLLLLPIGQRSVSQPAYGVCLFQASLIYGAPVLTTFSGLGYVLQLFIGMQSTMSQRPKRSLLGINIFLLVMPTIMATIMIVESLVVGSISPETVTIDSTRRYCHITNHTPRITAGVLIGIGCVGMVAFEVLICLHLSRHWVALRQMTNGKVATFAWYKLGRIMAFTIFPIGAFVLNIAGLFSSGTTNDKWNLLLPTLPLGAALIFGSQMDIIRAWKFWKVPNDSEASWNVYAESKPSECYCPHCCEKNDLVPQSSKMADGQ